MKRILGFYIPDKEDRRRRDKEVLHHYFRYGEAHKEKVGRLLEELVPGEKREYRMEGKGTQSFEEAVRKIKRKYIIISVNDTINRYYKAVMEADEQIREDLLFPCADEIRKMVEQDGKDCIV